MSCYEDLKALRIKYGTSEFDFSVKKLMRERVNSDRDKRIKFPNSLYQKKFDRQGGICACGCGERLIVPARSNHMDHCDPNRTDLNHSSNLQLMLPVHNLRKSSKPIQQQSKESGKPFTELIRTAIEDEV
jgi:hypothetical protein